MQDRTPYRRGESSFWIRVSLWGNPHYSCLHGSSPEQDAKIEEAMKLLETTDPAAAAELSQVIKQLETEKLDLVYGIQFPLGYTNTFWTPWLKNYHGEYNLGGLSEGPLFARIWVDQELKEEMR